MTRKELTARLAECEGHTPGEWPENRNTVENLARDIEAWRGGESWKDKTGSFERSANANKKLIALAPALASALREAWAEIDRLKAHLSNPLDEALNSGDGSYSP